VAASATAVIDTPYTEETGTNLPAEVYFLEYDLPVPIERFIAPMVVNRQQNFEAPVDGLIYQVDLANMNMNFPLKFMPEEVPQQFAQISRDQFGNIRIRFNASSGLQTRVSFDYIPVHPELYEAIIENSVSSIDVTFQDVADTVTLANHGLVNDQLVAFSSITTTTGISANTAYYVINSTADTFQLSLTAGGTAIDLVGDGSGDLITGPVDVVTNTIGTNGPHGLTNGTKIVFDVINSGTLPSGLNREQIYYVVNATRDTLQVSLTLGGTAQDISALGYGSFSFSNIPIIPNSFSNVLDYGASTYLLLDKNDERAESMVALTKSKMSAMISSNDREMSQSSGGRIGRLIPRLDTYSGPRRYWRQNVTP
jgi:hypothetical protein